MKPTKMRNRQIFQATLQTRSKQMGGALSKDLHKKYGKRSVRLVTGDNVTILRGEFKGVDGKVSKISTQKSSVAIDGVKKEKTKGDKFDVYIHTSNLVVTSLNSGDKWRIAKLEGKDPRKQPKTPAKEIPKKEDQVEVKKVESKETKVVEKATKKEVD
jgi:large subunit ribosomal protein L24